MKFLWFLLAIVIISSCYHRKEEVKSPFEDTPILKVVSKDQLDLVKNLGLVYYKNEPFTGISESYYITNHKAEIATYKQGRKHGMYRKWFENGTLSFEANYVDGKKDGIIKSWWSNGNLRSESRFNNGIVDGLQKQWYKSGSKFKELTIVNGKEEGLQKAWRENGKVYNNYEAKNGRVFGLKRANLCYELEDGIIQYKK